MNHWVWWLSGLMLALVPIANWLLVQRLMAVSGRFTALVDRIRLGRAEANDLSADEMAAAIREMTIEAFGAEAIAEADAQDAAAQAAPEPIAALPLRRPTRTPTAHVVFLVSLGIGGAISALLAGDLHLAHELRGETFHALLGNLSTPAVLLFGGMLVGFGTRMASGCTSGHGLCGVSRFQPGSLGATAAFFGAGILVSFAMEALL